MELNTFVCVSRNLQIMYRDTSRDNIHNIEPKVLVLIKLKRYFPAKSTLNLIEL